MEQQISLASDEASPSHQTTYNMHEESDHAEVHVNSGNIADDNEGNIPTSGAIFVNVDVHNHQTSEMTHQDSSESKDIDNQPKDNSHFETVITVSCDDDVDDEDDDFDDRIDIRDNANDEDQFAFEESNSANGVPGQGNFQDVALNINIPGKGDGDDQQGDVDDHDDEEGAENRVSDEEQSHDYHYDHHHIEDHFQRSHSESYEDDGGDKTLDVLLLEEICEEAANMTIKEALIHSLKPNVRAGLTTAHLRLSESEILTLEGYCEDFVGGLIKDLLRRTSLLQNENLEAKNNSPQANSHATAIKSTAKQLSAMEVKQLKIYCDHFVHNVIAESIIDSSMIVAKQQDQADQVKDILHVFQESDELQEYFTSLTTDIVRTALINVVTKEQLEGEIESDGVDLLESNNKNGSEGIESMMEHKNYSLEQDFDSFDFDDDHSFGLPSSELGKHGQIPQESHNGRNHNVHSSRKNGSKRRQLPQQPGDTPLEFDMEWVEGVLHDIGGTESEGRQKIVLRELDFDDRASARGNELLAPVFLAIAEENEDDNDFQGMRRKTQSIEDLCEYIEEEKEPPRKRSSSLSQLRSKRKQMKQKRPSFKEYIQDDEKPDIQSELESDPLGEDIFEGDQDSVQEEQDIIEEEDDGEEEGDIEEDEEEIQAQKEMQMTPCFEVTKTIQEKVYHAYDDDEFRWHTIRVNNREKVLDLRLIEPYMKVITHGGVHMPTRAVIVVVAACYLPDKSKRNYDFLMEQLFFYLISTLELLATADEYYLVYLNGGTTQGNMPGLPWMKRFYQHIEGGLKKQLIKMFIVHPNFWLKTVVRFARAFVGTTFWSKLEFMKSLDDLSLQIPTEFMYIPDEVIRCDPKYKQLHNL